MLTFPVLPGEPDEYCGLPHAALPWELLEDRRLKPIDLCLVIALIRHEQEGRPRPPTRVLAADLGCSKRTVQSALARLRAAGWVAPRPDGREGRPDDPGAPPPVRP